MMSSSQMTASPRACLDQTDSTVCEKSSCNSTDDVAAVSLETGKRGYITGRQLRALRTRLLNLVPVDVQDDLESDDSMTG